VLGEFGLILGRLGQVEKVKKHNWSVHTTVIGFIKLLIFPHVSIQIGSSSGGYCIF
jgi:hypothetical protein